MDYAAVRFRNPYFSEPTLSSANGFSGKITASHGKATRPPPLGEGISGRITTAHEASFRKRVQEYAAYMQNNNGKVPYRNSKNPEAQRLGNWFRKVVEKATQNRLRDYEISILQEYGLYN